MDILSRERNWPVHLLMFPLRFSMRSMSHMSFPGSSIGKESACDARDLGSIPGLGRCPGEGHGNPLQYSCLENPQGQRNLVGCSPWDRKESDTTEWLSTHTPLVQLSLASIMSDKTNIMQCSFRSALLLKNRLLVGQNRLSPCKWGVKGHNFMGSHLSLSQRHFRLVVCLHW